MSFDLETRPAADRLPRADLFATVVHGELAEEALSSPPDAAGDFHPEAACLAFLEEVQRLADSRASGGDKCDGRLYLHHIEPPRGYAPEAHRAVLDGLGISGRDEATVDEFLSLSKNRALAYVTAAAASADGNLTGAQAGALLYVFGTLLHAEQDRKHREGNWFHAKGETITSVEHFGIEFHQAISDARPGPKRRKLAVERTATLALEFCAAVYAGAPGVNAAERILDSLETFAMAPGFSAAAYRPEKQVMDFLFPVYATVPSRRISKYVPVFHHANNSRAR